MTSQLVSGNNTNDPRHLTQKQTLKKDDTLVYSCSDIKREIEQTLINFQSPAYCQPRHGQLYRLANAIYYPEKILLQDKEPLKLITTVHNNAKSNQYHGALFLNAKTSQIIIVNKGTDSLGSFWADIRAVVNGNLDNSHILSAITFALKVRDVVEELGGILQINVTGHSLGGFLSTLQAFAMEWLQFEENEIQARAIHTYRVHVVGFESPGSKDFLTKLWSNFFKEERYVNNKILECLDLTNYTTDPNAINTYGLHLGTMYSFSPAFYDLAGCYKINLRNINAHSVANFETLFDEEENIQQNANLRQILDHPLTTIMSGGELHKLQHRRMVNISPEEVLKWRRLTAFTPQVKQFLEAFELVRDLNVIKNDVLPPEIMGMLQSYVVTIGNGGFNGVQLTTQNVTTDQFVAEVDMSMRKNPHFIPQQLNAMKNCAKEWVRNLGFTTAAYFQGEVTDFNITEQTHIKYFQVEKLERKTNISVIDLLVGVNVVAKILKNKKSYQIFRVGDLVAAEFDYQRHITTDVAILTCMDDDEIYNAGKIADGIGVKVIIISQNRDGIALKWDDLQKKSQNKIMNMEVNLQGKTMLVSDLHIPVVMELLNNLLKKESTVFHLPPIGPLPEYFVEGRIAESRNSMGCVPQSPMQLQFSASVNELSDKILIITGTSGQGKSAFLTNLVTNQPRDGNITLFLQLRKVIPELKLLKTKLITMTQDDAVDFIANSIKLDEIERTILSQSLISVNGPRLNFFVDGFDEVCPDYEETLLKLFQILNKSTMKRMWISTNYHFEEKLVHTLECPSYKVLPLSVDSATALLSNRLNDLVKGWVGTPQQISLCQSWLAISQQWTNDGSMTTPLLILLLADHVAPIAKEFVSGEDITSLSPLKINIIQLFDSVFGEKLKITKDKMNIPVDGSVGTSEILEASVRDQHEFLALKELGVLENADLNRAFPRMSAKLDPQLISRQGIFYHDGSSYYSVHRAFAEYLAGSYLSKDLRVEDIDEIAEAVQIAIVREVAQPRYLQLLKKVINEELKEMGSIPVEKFKSYGESFIREMNKNWSEGCTFTHRINQDGNANILEFVLKSVKMLSDGVDTLKNFLGSRCGFQQSPMQDTQSAEIVNVMFKYADCLGMDEKKRILFGLGEDNFSYLSSFSVIVGRDEAFTALVGQTRGVLEDEEVSHLFFSEDKWGSTLLWSSVWANVVILDSILKEIKHRRLLKPLQTSIFPEGEVSLLNMATRLGHFEAWEKLYGFCTTELSLPENILKKELYLRWACTGNTTGIALSTEEKEQVLLGLDKDDLTIFDNKARQGAISELQSLLKTVKSDCPDILKTQILKNSFSPGSLFTYAIPYVITDTSRDTGIGESQYFMKFLRETHHPFPVVHSNSHADLWAWMTNNLNVEELNEALFERKETSGNTAFLMAIKFAGPGNTYLYDRIIEHFNTGLTPSEKAEILKMRNNQSPFHVAANARVDDFPLVRSLVNVALANGIDFMAAFAEEDAVGENVWEILVKWGHFVRMMDFTLIEKKIVLDREYVRNAFHRSLPNDGRNVVDILKAQIDQGWQQVTDEVKFYQKRIDMTEELGDD